MQQHRVRQGNSNSNKNNKSLLLGKHHSKSSTCDEKVTPLKEITTQEQLFPDTPSSNLTTLQINKVNFKFIGYSIMAPSLFCLLFGPHLVLLRSNSGSVLREHSRQCSRKQLWCRRQNWD